MKTSTKVNPIILEYLKNYGIEPSICESCGKEHIGEDVCKFCGAPVQPSNGHVAGVAIRIFDKEKASKLECYIAEQPGTIHE